MDSKTDKQGYIGNLNRKTTLELKDLLHRQNNILKKRNFLKTLPDGGRKVHQFAEKLRDLLVERGVPATVEDMPQHSNPSNVSSTNLTGGTFQARIPVENFLSKQSSSENTSSRNILQETSKTRNFPSEPSHTDSSSDMPVVDGKGPTEERKMSDISKMESGDCRTKAEDSDIEERLGKLYFGDDEEGEAQTCTSDTPDPGWKSSATYEKLVQKSEDMHSQMPFLPYCSLKISDVEALPEEFKFKSRHKQSSPASPKPQSHSQVLEDQPIYKYKQVKFIPLNEALQLQKQQKTMQEELHARQAAERLARGFGIKMEEFKPEGHLSYRNSKVDDEESEDDENKLDGIPQDLEELD